MAGRLNSTRLWEKDLVEMWTVPNWMRISLGCLGEMALRNRHDEWMGLRSRYAGCQAGPGFNHEAFYDTPFCSVLFVAGS